MAVTRAETTWPQGTGLSGGHNLGHCGRAVVKNGETRSLETISHSAFFSGKKIGWMGKDVQAMDLLGSPGKHPMPSGVPLLLVVF